ncbi:MAG: 16S rRNA (cytosine(1402)-N(4))-methyltransferase RsmH [Candidatus Tagabacteria bacterium]
MSHIPVLLKEVIKFLDPKPGDIILDATIDGGGHTEAILERILPDGKLIGIDQDKQLLDKLNSKNIILLNGNFRDLDKLFKPLKIKLLNGALYDLGMSSSQLEESGRGFTFLKDEPLLMTYKYPLEPEDLTAEKILNNWSEKEIADILFQYGEESSARRIAKKIAEERKKKRIRTTFELTDIIKKSVPHKFWQRINPATKTFQALRIAVNDELNAISESLEKVWRFLIPGSRLVIISFHSLEDRIAKNFLRNKKIEGTAEIKTPKPIRATDEEISYNPRSRSAKLRAAIKI